MTKDEAIQALNEIPGTDTEASHMIADKILLSFMEDNGLSDIAEAWRRVDNRVGFWYA